MKKTLSIVGFLCAAFLANAQELQTFIEQAYKHNPSIQALEIRYNIAQEKVSEARWIPNTELGAGYFISEPETRTGAQKARFSARQMLPWFGTVASREAYAATMAETDYLDYLIIKRKVALSVAQSYYALFASAASKEVLEKQIKLLKTYENLALTAVEVGKASAVDVLRLQIRQNELKQQQDMLTERYEAELAQFNSLLNRNSTIGLERIEELTIPETDPVSRDSLHLNPELIRFDKMYVSVSQAEFLNQKESAPMLGLGLDYIPVAERPEMNFSDNGKDIVMPMVSLSIPIFNQQFNSRSRQNDLRKQEINFQKQERLNLLEAAFARAISLRNQARIQFNTQEQNLKQARDAEEILIKNYETGTIDFRDVLDLQELQLKFRLNQIQAVQLYFEQSAHLNYLAN